MRRRYESVHTLQDRLEARESRIEVSLVDIEACAAAIIESSLRSGERGAIRTQLDALHADAQALAAAHDGAREARGPKPAAKSDQPEKQAASKKQSGSSKDKSGKPGKSKKKRKKSISSRLGDVLEEVLDL